MKITRRTAMGSLAAAALATPALSQTGVPYYRDKTVRIFVGAAAGGGFDLYARLFAQFLPRYLPGNPNIIVQNMAGAGSLTAANYIANVAPKDGTVIGAPNPVIVTDALIYPNRVMFDARKVRWLGSVLRETHVATAWHTASVKTFDDVLRRELIVAGSGGTTSFYPTLINAVLKTKFKLVSGYPGTAEANLAMERGEVEGIGGITWASVRAAQDAALKAKRLNILVQYGLTRHPELPDVPWIFDYARNPADRAALRLVMATQEMGRPFMVADGVPGNIVEMLRVGFDRTMNDKDFLADAVRRRLEIDPASGMELQSIVEDIYRTPAPVVERVRTIFETASR